MTYEAQAQVDALVAEIVLSDPDYDFQAEDGTHHTFWSIQDEESIAALETAINDLDCLYVADGHHRSAAASRVRNLHRDRNPEHSGEESYNYFLVVLFLMTRCKYWITTGSLKILRQNGAGISGRIGR